MELFSLVVGESLATQEKLWAAAEKLTELEVL